MIIAEASGSTIDLIKLLSGLGGTGVLAFLTVAWLKGWVVAGDLYRKKCEECRRWEDRAWGFHQTTAKAVETVKEVVEKAPT